MFSTTSRLADVLQTSCGISDIEEWVQGQWNSSEPAYSVWRECLQCSNDFSDHLSSTQNWKAVLSGYGFFFNPQKRREVVSHLPNPLQAILKQIYWAQCNWYACRHSSLELRQSQETLILVFQGRDFNAAHITSGGDLEEVSIKHLMCALLESWRRDPTRGARTCLCSALRKVVGLPRRPL